MKQCLNPRIFTILKMSIILKTLKNIKMRNFLFFIFLFFNNLYKNKETLYYCYLFIFFTFYMIRIKQKSNM